MKVKTLIIGNGDYESKQVKRLFDEMGNEAVLAASGRQGMQIASAQHPDLIILDLALHDISAIEVCRWAKLNMLTKKVPIIMLGGKKEIKERIVCIKEGAVDYIGKPVDQLEVKIRFDSFVREKLLSDALKIKEMEYNDLILNVDSLVIFDPVTGLVGKERFQSIIAKELKRASRYKSAFSCLIIDVNQGNKDNDSCGQGVSDVDLKAISEAIKEQVRAVDTLARNGEKGFMLLLTEQDQGTAVMIATAIAERIGKIPSERISTKEKELSVCIGISSMPDQGIKRAQGIIMCAEYALDKAKKTGEGRVQSARMMEVEKNPWPMKRQEGLPKEETSPRQDKTFC
ncbi:MAG: diguanylate cyclase [Nitrospira sp.]|nr:diguanylate cyclase [Candidatus Manganitrophaceae bacterium]HIL34875.1 diguanylate cyclase [Candidatus Manganitrophaceae bacterium]